MEINKLVEENLSLKSQLIENNAKLNHYDNILQRADIKYQEEINNYQKQLIKYNNYIHEIYIFFHNISANYLPELNFSLDKNESTLLNFEDFQHKLQLIENYICNLNKNMNFYKTNNGRINTDYSLDKKNNWCYTIESTIEQNNINDKIINNRIQKKVIPKEYLKNNKKNISFGKNKNINNSLISKYKYGTASYMNEKSNKKNYRNKNLSRSFKNSFCRSRDSSNKSNNKSYVKVAKKNVTFQQQRSRTPLTKPKNIFY